MLLQARGSVSKNGPMPHIQPPAADSALRRVLCWLKLGYGARPLWLRYLHPSQRMNGKTLFRMSDTYGFCRIAFTSSVTLYRNMV